MKKLLLPVAAVLIGFLLIALSFMNNSTSADLEIEIDKASLIMPAAHKVYENPKALNGQHYLFKTKIKNNGSSTLEDVTVRYRMPGFIEWSELDVIGEMLPGQSAVVACYPKFNSDITQRTNESLEKVEIEVLWDGADEDDYIEESFSIKMLGRNEYAYTCLPADEIASYSDMFDNNALIACYVTPNDPIVKYYTQVVQEKVLKGEQASVNRKPEEALRFLAGLYDATYLSHMVYSGTKGIPSSYEDVNSMVQHVRLPREVITGNTGLCIELSTLYASVLSNAGLDPIIYLIPGHAYPGFKLNGQYYAIEPTAIGGEGMGGRATSDQALQAGMKQLGEFMKAAQMGDPRYTLVDIHAVNQQGVLPMDLEDNTFMREKVNELAALFDGGGNANYAVNNNNNSNNRGNNNNNNNNSNRGARFPGSMSFTIPSGWQVLNNPVPQMPILTAQVISPDQVGAISVFDVPATSVSEALEMVAYSMSQFGSNLQYQVNGNSVSGYTYSNGNTFRWVGKAKATGSGVRFVAIGTPDYVYSQYNSVINSVYNSIR